MTEAVRKAIEKAISQYSLIPGQDDVSRETCVSVYDRTTADDSVNYPGEFVASFPDRQGAWDHYMGLVANAAFDAVMEEAAQRYGEHSYAVHILRRVKGESG